MTELIPKNSEPAVWPSGTEAAALCCGHGLHRLHEPPCSSKWRDVDIG